MTSTTDVCDQEAGKDEELDRMDRMDNLPLCPHLSLGPSPLPVGAERENYWGGAFTRGGVCVAALPRAIVRCTFSASQLAHSRQVETGWTG